MVGMHPAVRTTSPACAARVATWFDAGRLAAVHALKPPSSTRTLANPAQRSVHHARDACAPPELSYTAIILSLRIPHPRAFDCSSIKSGNGRRPDVGVGLPEKS